MNDNNSLIPASRRKLITSVGSILALAGLGFALRPLWIHRAELEQWSLNPKIFLAMFCGVIGYTLAVFLLALAWEKLLVWSGEKKVSSRLCWSIYARSQIAKYIPGNIFQLAGRQLLGRNIGLGHGPLAGSALFEVAGLLVAASAVALIGWLGFGNEGMVISIPAVVGLLAVSLLVMLGVSKLLPRISLFREYKLEPHTVLETARKLLPVLFLYVVFFLMAGGVLFVIAYNMAGFAGLSKMGAVVTISAFSWIAGFITPGAPAGLGVREGLLVAGLSGIVGQVDAVFIAAAFRIVTMLGDTVFYLIGLTTDIDSIPGQ